MYGDLTASRVRGVSANRCSDYARCPGDSPDVHGPVACRVAAVVAEFAFAAPDWQVDIVAGDSWWAAGASPEVTAAKESGTAVAPAADAVETEIASKVLELRPRRTRLVLLCS